MWRLFLHIMGCEYNGLFRACSRFLKRDMSMPLKVSRSMSRTASAMPVSIYVLLTILEEFATSSSSRLQVISVPRTIFTGKTMDTSGDFAIRKINCSRIGLLFSSALSSPDLAIKKQSTSIRRAIHSQNILICSFSPHTQPVPLHNTVFALLQ